MFINTFCFAQDLPKSSVKVPAKEKTEVKSDIVTDTIISTKAIVENEQILDSAITDSVKPKKSFLESIIKSKAKDYVLFNKKEQRMYLYNEAEVIYKDMEIKAGSIIIDYSKEEVYAGRIKDSSGEYSQHPIFKQGDNLVEPDSIRFNYTSKKALIFNSRTEQNGMTIFAERSKKQNDSVYFMENSKLTTAKDIDDPEYYFYIKNVKIVPNKKVVAGPTQMYIYDVPTPVWIPFAFFPLADKETSGIIFPSFGEQNDRGYFLQNGGYYFAISDYFDLATLGDYYTNGSYGLRLQTKYNNRYNFNGNFSFRYENQITSERGFSDYAKSTIYNIQWQHSKDAKSNPSSRFSASVNLGSSTYYKQSNNQVNQSSFLNNNLSSSISYSKTFQGEPQANVSLTATHSQNAQTQAINMTLPTLQASVGRVYPFAPKDGAKKGALHNINLQYNLRGENRISTTDSLFFKKEMFDDAQLGLKHSIPLSTNFKVMKYFSVSAGTSYDESWVFKTVNKSYDQINEEEIIEEVNGFDTFRTYNFSSSIGTTLYGLFNFDKKEEGKKIQAIRHVIRPSVSYNINPSFDKYYDTYEVIDADGTTTDEVEYSRFDGGLYGAPNKTYSSSIGLSLTNNFEAKVRDRDSTKTEAKKIILLNNLNFSTSYNLAGDSLQWSPVRMAGGTQLFDNKLSVNFGATLDPYALDNNNKKINTFNINNGGSLFRMTSANLIMSYSLSSDGKGDKESTSERSRQQTLQSGGRNDDLFGVAQDFADQGFSDDDEEENDDEASENYNFKIPWSLRLAYTANYSNTRRESEISSHSLMFSGDIELSPKWSIGGSSGYDFKGKGFTFTTLRFSRDLLSWKMNFSWIPFSDQSSWNFFIGIKSNLLKDLKYEKRKRPDKNL